MMMTTNKNQLFLTTLSMMVLLFHSHVTAWGGMGHRVTGKVAMRLMNTSTKQAIASLISDMDGGDLGRAATWADEIKRAKGYGWTGVLHYVDAKNNPPHECGFDQGRDCADGKCITSAIGNYTTRLSCRYSADERAEAVKFLTHFIGDLTQPLHTCDRLVGGNKAPAIFDGKKSKMQLHSVWDTQIVEKRVNTQFHRSEDEFVAYLVNQVKNADWAEEASNEWASCVGKGSKDDGLACAIEWAKDSDGLNCDLVWKLYDKDPNANLGKEYYEKTYPTMERQIAKAGVRMAKLFEAKLKKCSSDEEGGEEPTN
jgi:hypothetical protein